MQSQKNKFHTKLLLTILFLLTGFINNKSVSAQITPDNTLGAETSIVDNLNEIQTIIYGGAIRDINLFHSFQEFNVNPGTFVYFINPIGVEKHLNSCNWE